MRGVVCLILALFVFAAPAALADPPKTSLKEIENEVMCQVCGTPLALAQDAPEAQRERAYIVALIEQGKTKPEIEQALVDQYGPSVLAVPKDRGFGLAAYLVPAGAILLAAGAITAVALRWRGARQGPDVQRQGGEALDDAASRRLSQDLERYDL